MGEYKKLTPKSLFNPAKGQQLYYKDPKTFNNANPL